MRVHLRHSISHHEAVMDNKTGEQAVRVVKFRGLDTEIPAVETVYVDAGRDVDLPDEVAEAAIANGTAIKAERDDFEDVDFDTVDTTDVDPTEPVTALFRNRAKGKKAAHADEALA